METQDTQESSELILYTVMARYGAWRSSSKKFISEMGTYLFYRIVAYGVIERLLAIFVIRNKKYKTSTGLLFSEINLTDLLKIHVARDIRYYQKTYKTYLWPSLNSSIIQTIFKQYSTMSITKKIKSIFWNSGLIHHRNM